jgi:hypothetical protein
MWTIILLGFLVVLLAAFITAWLLKGDNWDQPLYKRRDIQTRRRRR